MQTWHDQLLTNFKTKSTCTGSIWPPRGGGEGGGNSFIWAIDIGMCGPKGYGFSAVLVINRVSILADFGHFGHK